MFRTSFRTVAAKVGTAVAALSVGAVLTACEPVKPGAAATVGDRRITTAQLDSAVVQWREEFGRNPDAARLQRQLRFQGQQVPFDPDSPPRSVLRQLIELQVWDEVARQEGITITQGQIDETITRNGGDRVINANLLAGDLPTRYSHGFVRSRLIIRAIAQRAGVNVDGQGRVDPQREQEALRHLQTAYLSAARALNIKINPRYGSFDPQESGMAPVVHTLSRTESGTR